MRLLFVPASMVLLLVGCGSSPYREPAPVTAPEGTASISALAEPNSAQPMQLAAASQPPAGSGGYSRPEPEPTSGDAARSLMQTAESQAAAGDSTAAAATLERALRIEPRNPVLLSRLASVRYSQGQYQRAVNFAAKSNSLASGHTGLKRNNWQLIAKSRRALGDEHGAREAEQQANGVN